MRKPAIMNKVRKNFGSHGKLDLYSYKNTFLIGIAVVVVVALIASIFVKVGNKHNDKNSAVNPKDIYVHSLDIGKLNPVNSKYMMFYQVSKLMYEGLYELDKNMTPKEKVVSKVIRDKYKKNVFHMEIEKNVKWHDGNILTANDVAFSFGRLKERANENIFGRDLETVEKITATGQNSIDVQFKSEDNINFAALTFPIFSKTQYQFSSSEIPIGSGKYKVVEYKKGKELILSGHKDYRGKVPGNRIIISIFPDSKIPYRMIGAGKVAMVFEKSPARKAKIRENKVSEYDFVSNRIEVLGFNFKKKHVKTLAMRKAIYYAINKETILNEAYYGKGVLQDSLYYPNFYGIKNKKNLHEYEPSKSREILKKQGFEDKNKDGYLENTSGRLGFNMIVSKSSKERIKSADLIAKGFEKAGISLKTDVLSKDEYENRLKKGDFDMFLGELSFNKMWDLSTFLARDGKHNHIGYDNELVNIRLSDFNKSADKEKSRKILKHLDQMITDDLPYISILKNTEGVITSTKLRGNINPKFFEWFFDVESFRMN